MDETATLRGTELRYALTLYLAQHGAMGITALIDGLTHQGFLIPGHPPKTVSDALRWEMAHGRVRRLGRGTYGPLEMPRSTDYRIHQRVLALREQAARIRSDAGNSHRPRKPNMSPWTLNRNRLRTIRELASRHEQRDAPDHRGRQGPGQLDTH